MTLNDKVAETVDRGVSAGHSPSDKPSNDTKSTVSTVSTANCGSAAKSFVGNQAYKSPFPLPTGAAGGLSTRRAAGHGTVPAHPASASVQLNPGDIKGDIWATFKPQPLNVASGVMVRHAW